MPHTLLLIALAASAGRAADFPPAHPTRSSESLWSRDFESDDGAFIAFGDTDQWSWGQSTIEPSACHGGTGCWATMLNDYYLNSSVEYLQLPQYDLVGLERPLLAFYQWYSIESGDHGVLEVFSSEGWQQVVPIYGYPTDEGFSGESGDWVRAYLNLSGLDSLSSVRLRFSSNERGAAPGWAVDDFELYNTDIVPPYLGDVTLLPDTEDLDGPYLVQAVATDDNALSSVLIRYTVNSGPEIELPMVEGSASTWSGAIPGQALGSRVQYQVVALDGYNETLSPEKPHTFLVTLPRPGAPTAESSLIWGTTVDLSWSAPVSGHELLGYVILRDTLPLQESSSEQATVALTQGEQQFSVAARFDVGDSDPSEPLFLSGSVPSLGEIEPALGYQGDLLRVLLQGENLLLTPETVQVSLGADVEINSFEVRNADSAWLRIEVLESATPGPRSLRLITNGVEVERQRAFEVFDGAERPTLVELSPTQAAQGDSLTLLIRASDPFAKLPVVTLGETIVVERVGLVEADLLEIDLVIPWSTPLGPHPVEVDDGTRVFSGLELEIRNQSFELPTCSCASSRGSAPPWAAFAPLGLMIALGWRRRESRPTR